jgi:transposase
MSVKKSILERRRLRAWKLYQEGWRCTDIAKALSVSKAAVSQWIARARQDGETGLRRRTATGAPPKLSPRHRLMLTALIRQNPRDFGYEEDHWTRSSLGNMIERLFGVTYSPQHVGRLLNAAESDTSKLPKMINLELLGLLRDTDMAAVISRLRRRG